MTECCYSSFGCKFKGETKQHEVECPYKFIEENEKLKQQLKEPSGQVDFKTCLVVDKYGAVTERLKKGALNLGKLIAYLKNQQYALEQYGKQLSTASFSVEHLGELTDPNHQTILFSHSVGNKYLHFSNYIKNSMMRDLETMSNEITKVLVSSAKKEKINRSEYEQAIAQAKNNKTRRYENKTQL